MVLHVEGVLEAARVEVEADAGQPAQVERPRAATAAGVMVSMTTGVMEERRRRRLGVVDIERRDDACAAAVPRVSQHHVAPLPRLYTATAFSDLAL